jgi:hypothetical protein
MGFEWEHGQGAEGQDCRGDENVEGAHNYGIYGGKGHECWK